MDKVTGDSVNVLGWVSGANVVLADSCVVGCVSSEVIVAEDARLPLGVGDEYSVAGVSSVVGSDSVTSVLGVVKTFSDGDTVSVDACIVFGCVELKSSWVVL